MTDNDLITLTSCVIARIKPNQGDCETVDDCWQTAYLAGLQALRNCQANAQKPSSRYLTLCMQTAVYRFLHKLRPEAVEIRDDDSLMLHTDFDQVDADDFITAHLSALTRVQARTLMAFCRGEDKHQIARREGIKIRALNYRIETALKKLRSHGQN